MKNALILHGTNNNSKDNWFPWLSLKLDQMGYKVWCPDAPNAEKYNVFLQGNTDWDFNKESILIGHSSGAVAILTLLQTLPENIRVDTCYMIGAFTDDLTKSDDWAMLRGLFTIPLDFELLKKKANRFVFIHSDNDPYCPLGYAEYLAEKLNGHLVIEKGQKHFSVRTFGEKYREFPLLLNLIKKNAN